MNASPDNNHLFDWFKLSRLPKVGPVTFNKLLTQYGNATAALKNFKTIPAEIERSISEEFDQYSKNGVHIIPRYADDYPSLLKHIYDPPPVLLAKGHIHLLNQKSVAIVGARNASYNGRKFAEQLAFDLNEKGIVVVSGLARGIDVSAHQGSLRSRGWSIAVMPMGIDTVYPQENLEVYKTLCTNGLIVTEMPASTAVSPQHFPRRNRIISGLSLGVIVVEAAMKSGSLITVSHALEQGRSVMAVPGSPLDPRTKGCHHLIKQGGILIESSQDVIDILLEEGLEQDSIKTESNKIEEAGSEYKINDVIEEDFGSLEQKLMNEMSHSPTPIDILAFKFSESGADFWAVITKLEMSGKIIVEGSNVSLLD